MYTTSTPIYLMLVFFHSSLFFLSCWPSNDNRLCKVAADKWRENFSTESEMLSHLFAHSCLSPLRKDRLFFAASQISFNELVIDSLVLIIMQNLSECFTYSKWHHCDLLKLWDMALNVSLTCEEIKICIFYFSHKQQDIHYLFSCAKKIHVCKHDNVMCENTKRNRKVDNKIEIFSMASLLSS